MSGSFRPYYPAIMTACAVVVGLSWAIATYSTTAALTPSSLSACFSSAASYAEPNPACLQSTVQTLLQRYDAKNILGYVSASTSPASLTSNCHDIGHVVGEALFSQAASIEKVLAQCPTICSQGCLHGVIGAGITHETGASSDAIVHGDLSTIIKSAAPYCGKSDSLCHGVGHVLFLSTRDIPKSLAACAQVSSGSSAEACFQGVFMESFGSKLSLQFNAPDIVAAPGDYLYPCTTYAPEYQHACFRFLTGFHLSQSGISQSIPDLRSEELRACMKLHGTSRSDCFEGIGYDGSVSQANFDDYDDIEEACESLPSASDRIPCIRGIVEKYINYEDTGAAKALCAKLPEAEKQACRSE